MWQPLFGGDIDDVPITHVTNGVHVPTWLGPEMKGVLDRHLGARWLDAAHDPATWDRVDGIPDAELWAARTAGRNRLVDFPRTYETDTYAQRGVVGLRGDIPGVADEHGLACAKRLVLDPIYRP